MLNIITGAVSLGLLWSVMALGVYLTFRVLDYADMTVDGSIVTGAAIAAKLLVSGVNPVLATMAAFFGGMAAGVVTGLLHTKLKIPAILSGILSQIGLYSINIKIMGKPNTTLLKVETIFSMFTQSKQAVLICGGITAVAFVVLLYMFLSTSMGSALRATGNNEKMANAMGINIDSMKILGLALGNGLVAFSGALIAQSQGYADMGMGQGSIVIGLASVIIGEVLYHRTSMLGKLSAVLIGAVTYRIIIALVIDMGMDPLDLKLFTAITVTVALSMPRIKNYLFAKLNTLKKHTNANRSIKVLEKEGKRV
ncbi:MAG: ABC transporter permease [Oscillospiraceae bacterium]|nr:ABC transporter permease [Oscillospiraceae bacterium]